MRKGYWKHPKFQDKKFKGFYERSTKTGKRILTLEYAGTSKADIIEIFESHEKAKAAGWEKCHVN